jgi:glutathione S-transferase
MLTLYTKPGCPYCAKVLTEAVVMGIEFDERSVAEPGVVEQLVERGGHAKTPFLMDSETGKSMYGSDDIITYLHERFKEGPVR